MPFAIKIGVKGVKRLDNKIQHRVRRYYSQTQNIFEDPLGRTLFLLRKKIVLDVAGKRRNHVFTGRLFKSIGSNFQVISGTKLKVQFGYYVPYGLAIEMGAKPRWISISILEKWALHRFGSTDPARAIQRSIAKKGTKEYNIIRKTWKNNQQNYINIVHKRFWKALIG